VQRRLPIARLAAYAAPALPLAVLQLPVYLFVPAFYAVLPGISTAGIGWTLIAVRLLDGVTDPLMGWLTDRTPVAFGRRKVWLLLGAPLAAIFAWALFRPPADATLAWFALSSAGLTLAWTIAMVPYYAWGAELSGDYAERARITGVRESAGVLGTLIATATPAVAAGLGFSASGDSLSILAIGLAVSLPLAAGIAAIGVPEPQVYSVQRVGLRDGLAALGQNRPFLILIAAFLLNGIANGLPATLFLFFATHVLASPESAGPLLFAYFLCGIAGVPVWVWIARRIGKAQAWIIAMLIACPVFALVPFVVGRGDVTAFLAVCVVTGFCVGADLTLPGAMQADVVDVDTADSGEQRTGLYMALWGLATKLALALTGLTLPVLDWAGFDARAATQTPGATLWLAGLYAWAPVAFKAAAIALMALFPITPQSQAATRALIEQRFSASTIPSPT